jgi:hypothetical protein
MAWAQTPIFALRRLAQKRITAAGSAKSRAGAGITKQLFSSVAWQQDREAAVLKKIRSKTPRRAKTAPARVRNAEALHVGVPAASGDGYLAPSRRIDASIISPREQTTLTRSSSLDPPPLKWSDLNYVF